MLQIAKRPDIQAFLVQDHDNATVDRHRAATVHRIIASLLVVLILAIASPASGAGSNWLEIGVRIGVAGEIGGQDFKQWEITSAYRLPWDWKYNSGWTLGSRLNASIGAIRSDGETAAVVTLGPGLALFGPKQQFAVEAGISPTLISEDEYGEENLGSNFQFTSFIGMSYRLGQHLKVSGRVQHMSNAGIGDPNPGLDQGMLGFSYRF